MAHDHNIHQEQDLGKVYDSRLMKRLIRYLKPYLGKVIIAFLFLVCASFIGLAGPWIIKVGIDDYIAKNRVDELWIIAAIYLGVLISHFIVQYSQVYLLQDVAQSAMKDLRRDIFSHLQKLPVKYFDKNPIGRLVTRVVNDVDVLNQMFAAGIVTIIGDIITLSGIIVVLLLMDVRLALITYTVLPVMLGGMFLFKIKARQAFRKIRTRIAAINAFMQERIGGMSIVQVFTQEKQSFQQFAKANWKHTEANLEAVLYYSIFFPATSIVLSLATALILWFGGGEIIRGAISFGVLVAFAQYAERFFRPIADLSEKYNVLQQAMASGERIFQLLDSEPEEEIEAEKQIPLEQLKGEIEFKNVWFAYNGQDWVLKDINFRVKAGEKVAIVGATGAGKSSLINVLTRFYPIAKGEILVDGQNISRFGLCNLRHSIGVVQQDVFIFSGSIAKNISLGTPGIMDTDIKAAARLVNASKFIEKYPEGYETLASERGGNFSVGQKQLLSFARALAHSPSILVLDEATANIDTETEILIQEGLARLIKDRTALIIAHRLSTIKNVDKILVLHKGELVEQGSHSELLEIDGIYKKLYKLQYREQEKALD